MRNPSVILLSGGLDSAANLALCAERDQPLLAVTADYGQRAARREIEAARALCEYYAVPHIEVDLRWLGELGGSALTDPSLTLPEPARERLDELDSAKASAAAVWVPNRNGVLINVAAAYAERNGASRVVVGFNSEEAATFPDNSVGFLKAAGVALAYSTRNQCQVFSYTAEWDKTTIVRELKRLARPFPFEKLWSCYQGGAKPCGQCESCKRLRRAMGVG